VGLLRQGHRGGQGGSANQIWEHFTLVQHLTLIKNTFEIVKNGSAIFMDPETNKMLQFLASETDIMGERIYITFENNM